MGECQVLVVDDQWQTGEVARNALRRFGRVARVADGQALAKVLEGAVPDLVVTPVEVVAPDAGPLLHWLARAYPGVAVVTIGDGDDEDCALDLVDSPGHGFVARPVAPAALAAAAARALDERQRDQELRRLRIQQEAADDCQRLLRCLDPATVHAVALDLLLAGTGRVRGIAHFRRPALPGHDGIVFRGFARPEAQALRQALARREPLDAAHSGAPAVGAEGMLGAALRDVGLEHPGAALTVPLSGQEREAGVLHVFDDGAGFDELQLLRAQVIAAHARTALENAERYQGAKVRALLDDATGLHNVRYLLESADHEIERAARYGLELSLLFVDVDRFKQVNDARGHLVGTATLRGLADCLRGCVRQIDTLARYGGDEFTLLLTDTSPAAARTAAERIRSTVAGQAFPTDAPADEPVQVTVSIGVACYPHDTRGRQELLDLADKAMYRAKSLGRNRVALAAELSGGSPG